MKPTVAAVLRQHGAAYLDAHSLSMPQAKAWRAICACRTPALGGQCLVCSTCSHTHWQYHSCRNRHCPTCGARASDAWLQKRIAQVLDVPYLHMVFALPQACSKTSAGTAPPKALSTCFLSEHCPKCGGASSCKPLKAQK
jgi:Transposase zinc-binding domain